MKPIIALVHLLIWVGLAPTLFSQELPEEFFLTIVEDGFERARGLDFDPAGNTYLYEHLGKVWRVDSSGQRAGIAYLDLTERVSAWNDHGLLGFCLDRDFLTNGYCYALYAVDTYWDEYRDSPGYNPDSSVTNAPTWGRVSRFRADPANLTAPIDPATETILLGNGPADGILIHHNFHGLGKIRQALDGTLLISNGDGAGNSTDNGTETSELTQTALDLGWLRQDQHIGSYRSQYLDSPRGKILRIDAETGAGLPSNPFYDAAAPTSPASRTWALGLRNPYTFYILPETGSHDPAAGEPGTLVIGEVGNGAWEELNVCTRGGQNFGWPHYEGAGLYWAFQNGPEIDNLAAPNPLAGGGCPTYLSFHESFVELGGSMETILPNPCDPTVAFAYPGNPIVSPPALVWSNANYNLPARSGVAVVEPGQGSRFEPLPDGQPAFGGYSSLGGFPLRGDQWPTEYRNKLLFYDYSGWVMLADLTPEGELQNVAPFAAGLTDILCLEQNPYNGRMYYLSSGPFLREFTFGGNPPPVAKGELSINYGGPELDVTYSAAGSSDQNAEFSELTFHWDFNDGQTAMGPSGNHTFSAGTNETRTFRPVLTVTDPEGATATDTLVVSLNNNPPAVEITSFSDGDRYPLDQTNLLELTATVNDPESAPNELRFRWESFLHHNTHFHPETSIQRPTAYTLIEPLGCGEETYYVRVKLTVTDPQGLSTVREQFLYPDCAAGGISISEFTVDYGSGSTNVEASFTLDADETGRYFVQRSNDLFNFRTLPDAEFAAQGRPFSSGITQPSYGDDSPAVGTNFYRIKTISETGRIRFGPIESIQWPRPLDFNLFPNPNSGRLQIELREVTNGQFFTFRLFDLRGQEVHAENWIGDGSAGNENRTINLPRGLARGIYVYRLEGSAEVKFVGKLLVQD